MNAPSVAKVATVVRLADPTGQRIGRVMRSVVDLLLDGPATGRFRWEELHLAEQRNAGAVMEILMQREFGFPDGGPRFTVGGVSVVGTFAPTPGPWPFSRVSGEVVVLCGWADDADGACGLAAAAAVLSAPLLSSAQTAERATTSAMSQWIQERTRLPTNVLAQLGDREARQLRSVPAGQQRVNELFRVAQQRKISSTAVATVATQKDFMKRVRYNGGARTHLQNEGIVVLGDTKAHQEIAAALGVPIPSDGDFVSARLTATSTPGPATVALDGQSWRLAEHDDPPTKAPLLP